MVFHYYTILKNMLKYFYIPESFSTNISHQLFDYKITFVNSQHETQIPKVILLSKTDLNVRIY